MTQITIAFLLDYRELNLLLHKPIVIIVLTRFDDTFVRQLFS